MSSLQNNINAISGGGVTQAALEAADRLGSLDTVTACSRRCGSHLRDRLPMQPSRGRLTTKRQPARPADATFALAELRGAIGGADSSRGACDVVASTPATSTTSPARTSFSPARTSTSAAAILGDSFTQNGRGNLVVGYNESVGFVPGERGGSHNLVVGPNHRYNFGVGLVVGDSSRLGNDGASVSGGFLNSAAASFSSVSAGLRNDASGDVRERFRRRR